LPDRSPVCEKSAKPSPCAIASGAWVPARSEEDRRRIQHLDHAEARLELFRLVARELRPGFGARDDGLQVAHHLAAVADAQAEGVGAAKKAANCSFSGR
jgi:hypothetical protein